MIKRFSILAALLAVLAVAVISEAIPPTPVHYPVKEYGVTYWDMVTETDETGTVYYPSRNGFSVRNIHDLSIWLMGDSVTVTIEAAFAYHLTAKQAYSAGATTIKVLSTQGAALYDGVYVGPYNYRAISAIDRTNNLIKLSAPLTSGIAAGTDIVINPTWFDVTTSTYNLKDYSNGWGNTAYTNFTGQLDMDNLNTERIRIKAVYNSRGGDLQIKVRLRE